MDQDTPPHGGKPPAYLANADIRAMFHWLLDRLDDLSPELRTRSLSRRVDVDNFTPLFKPARPDDDHVLWELMKRCQKDGLIRLQSEKKRRDPRMPPWIGMRIVFHLESEPALRQWLDRPLVTPETWRWQLALKKWAHAFKRVAIYFFFAFFNASMVRHTAS